MKKHFIWLLLALVAVTLVSCDDEDSLDAAGGIIESIESGEMMYKLDYIGSDITASDEYALYSYSETWDHRPIALVNNDAYIYDLDAGEFSHMPRSIEDELYRYSLSGTWFSLADGGYVVSCNRILLSELEGAAENISLERGFVKLYDGVIERYYPSPAEFPTVFNEYDQFLCDADGYFYLFSGSEQSYSVFSPDLEFMYTLDAPENILDLQYLKRYDGEVYLVHAGNILDGERVLYLRSFDHEARGWSSLNDSKTIPASLVESEGGGVSEVIFGGGLDYYYIDAVGVFGCNEGEQPRDYLVEWLDVGLDWSRIADVTIYSPELIFVRLHDTDGGYSYGKIELVPVSSVYGEGVDVPPTLRIACDTANNYATKYLLDYASSFVQSEFGCKVEIVSYTDTDSLDANQQLVRDISSGNPPDLVIFGGGLDYETLARFDIFADLYGFMDGEFAPDEFSSADLLPCVREPFETADGELCQLIFSFALANITGSEPSLSDGVTVDELRELNASLGSDEYLTALRGLDTPADSANMLLELLLPYMLFEYVDYDSAAIDTDRLGELLELCLEARVCGYDSLFVDPALTRGGIVSLNITNIYDPAQFLIDRYINFPHELYYAGFPGSSGCILPYSSLAIVDGENNELAWRLILHMLDCQTETFADCDAQTLVSGQLTFPCTYDAVDTLCERLETIVFGYKSGYIDDSYSLTINAYDTDYTADNDTLYLTYTAADLDALIEIFETADGSYASDGDIMSIIYEEAQYYFDGAKPLDEVLGLTCDRVELKLGE